MVRFDVEPSLDEVFSDPMIHVLMKREPRGRDDLRGFLQDMRSKLGAAPRLMRSGRRHISGYPWRGSTGRRCNETS